jgi:non-heme chloroperoxidase
VFCASALHWVDPSVYPDLDATLAGVRQHRDDVSAAVDAAPFRGVLPLPLSTLKAASPALSNPANRHRAVPLTFEQFRFAFASAVSEDEARRLYEQFAVPAPGAPLFQAAAANFDPRTEAKVDIANPDRGPLLIISGEQDNTISRAEFKRQEHHPGVTEFAEIPGRGQPTRERCSRGARPMSRPSRGRCR